MSKPAHERFNNEFHGPANKSVQEYQLVPNVKAKQSTAIISQTKNWDNFQESPAKRDQANATENNDNGISIKRKLGNL